MRTAIVFLLVVWLVQTGTSTTIIVSKYGGGNYTTIQAGVNGANGANHDTVKVMPGEYFEHVDLNKNIVLMGSGCENTLITGPYDPVVTMSNGQLQWFRISSQGGNGLLVSAGAVKNCVFIACGAYGIASTSGTATVDNCICLSNNLHGVWANGGTLYVTNCVSRSNGSGSANGFYKYYYAGGALYLNYSNGSRVNTTGNVECIDIPCPFEDESDLDYHVSLGGACWDTGNPTLSDPDASRSDMGYFGGPDCPVFPIVRAMTMTKNGTTTTITVRAKANY